MSDRVLRYAPQAQEKNQATGKIYEIERQLLDGCAADSKSIFDDVFVSTAGSRGIKRFEQLFGLKPGQDDTLEHRRQMVLQKISYRPPFTRQTLGELLHTLFGDGNYVYEIIPSDFQLVVDVDTDDPEAYLQFQKDLRRKIPANLTLVMLIQYIHAYLKKKYTYGEMHRRFTYGELSRYAHNE